MYPAFQNPLDLDTDEDTDDEEDAWAGGRSGGRSKKQGSMFLSEESHNLLKENP